MTLNEIKIEAIKKNTSMSDIARKLGVSRTWMYKKINEKDESFLNEIKKVLS